MNTDGEIKYLKTVEKKLFWTGIATLLVSLKLLFSFFVPGLKTPGELVLSGVLLIACTWQIFDIYSNLKQDSPIAESK
jgi:hypothetical protein